MKSKLPSIKSQTKICIICEGDEEYEFLEKLKSFGMWNAKYDIVLENADGNGNVPARYQDKYQNNSFDLVLIFCDTDRKSYEQYVDIKQKIDDFHGVKGAADMVLIYGNPCTMQIVIQHWKEIRLKSPAKKVKAVFGYLLNWGKRVLLQTNLNREIKMDDSLGGGFRIGHSYFCGRETCEDEWMKSVVYYDIIPMLQEYWFDDKQKVQRWENLLIGVFND